MDISHTKGGMYVFAHLAHLKMLGGNDIERAVAKAASRVHLRGWRDGSAVRTLAALPEVLSSIPSNHMVAHNHL